MNYQGNSYFPGGLLASLTESNAMSVTLALTPFVKEVRLQN